MLTKVLAFELRYQLRSPLFAIGFAIFFLFAYADACVDFVQIGNETNLHVNSAFNILQKVGIMNVLGLFVFTAFMANVVIRDDETGMASMLYATRITKFDYLTGRFLGSYVVSFLVLSSVPLGIFIGSLMPWLDVEKVGPHILGHYLYVMLVATAPTVLTFGAAFFALATATRSMMWTYVGAVASLVLWIVAQTLLRDPAFETASVLADPFALAAVGQATRYWTAIERNSQVPDIAGLLLYNRLLWMGIGIGLFAVAYALFSFETKARAGNAAAEPTTTESAPLHVTPAPLSRTRATAWLQLLALTRFDVAFVLKSPAFFVLLAIGVLLTLGALQPTVETSGVEFFPVTRAVIDVMAGSFVLFPMIIAVYYAGELVWRDRERRIHEIVDASAAPNWTFLVPKMIAVVVVLTASFLVATLTAILFQLSHGYTQLQLPAYLLWFVLPMSISAVLLAALAVVVQALVPNKFMGWAAMLLYIVASSTLQGMGFEHHLYDYASASQVPLSDMNGAGRFWIGRAWFHGYWSLFALMMLVFAHLLWRRGADTSLLPRLRRLPRRLNGASGGLLTVSAAAWLGVGAFIFYNTNVLNEYRTSQDRDRELADFEKELLAFESVPQPRIIDVKLNVDLYPQQVRAVTTGTYIIENRTTAPLPAVHVNWDRRLELQELAIDGARMTKDYPQFAYRIYTFATPLAPGERRQLRFATKLEERGFPNSRPLTRIVANGTFLDNTEIAPLIGMNRAGLLSDRSIRRKYDLPAELRPAKLEDAAATAHQYVRRDSDWVTAEIKVSTDADQTPVAPGYTVSDTVQGQRRVLVTRTDSPILHYFSIQSARYAVKRDVWSNPNGSPVDLAVYYHPAHDHNIQRMLDAMKVSLELFSEKFSPFQFRQARILEFPAYDSFAQSFANTVPYSESIGFIQNYHDERSAETVDRVTYVTAHEIGHQWWAHQVIGADKQGMTVLSETFAQYSALLVMEKLYGREQIRKFLKTELDGYLRRRGTDVLEELPLNRVENQPYIYYQKGGLVMYWLKEVIGEDVVNRTLQKLLAQFAFKPAPYPSATDFLTLLRAEAGPQYDGLITDLFEKITVYDMQASDAKAKRLPNGSYQVSFTVTARKLYADGQGKETEAPLDEPFDVGAFTAEPGRKGYTNKAALLLERRAMRSGKQTVTLVVNHEPKFVGIDPYNMRIDRNSDDNLTTVEME